MSLPPSGSVEYATIHCKLSRYRLSLSINSDLLSPCEIDGSGIFRFEIFFDDTTSNFSGSKPNSCLASLGLNGNKLSQPHCC